MAPLRFRKQASTTKAAAGAPVVPEAVGVGLVLLAALVLAAIPFCMRERAREDSKVSTLPPAPHHWVNDHSGLLSNATRNALDAELHAYQDESGNHVVIYIIPTTNGPSIEALGMSFFNASGIGDADENNGVLLLIVTDAGEAMRRIQLGHGVEEAMSNAEAARICREVVKPGVEQGPGAAADAAVVAGARAIVEALRAFDAQP